MDALILQIGLKQGRSAEIHRLQDRELYIGRAYSNDIVLTDPYVAPEQLRVYCYTEDGQEASWFVNVLDTTNPVLLNGKVIDTASVPIRKGDQLTVGRTQLRIYSESHDVEPTRKLVVSGWLHKLSRSSATPLLLFAGVCGLNGLLSYLLANTDGEWKTHALGILELMGALLVWAGGWAVVGRLLRHQTLFSQHLLITTLVFAVGLLLLPVENFLEFLSDNVQLRMVINFLFFALLTAYLLRQNLHLATNMKHTALIAIACSFSLTAMMVLYTLFAQDQRHHQPEYSSTLLPPAVNPRSATELDDYLSDMNDLFTELDD